MTENMKKLLELASTNEELKKKLETATKETLIELAKENGIELSEEDFARETGEISEDELEAVAGGHRCDCPFVGDGNGDSLNQSKDCVCVIGGGGEMEDNTTRCVCIVGGSGVDHGIRC